MKHFNLELIRQNAKKMAKEIAEETKKQNEIIKEQYNGDEDAYYENTFNMAHAALLTNLSIEDIRIILIKNLDDNSPRKIKLQNAFHATNMTERLEYPGGYNSFIDDVKNNYFKNISLWIQRKIANFKYNVDTDLNITYEDTTICDSDKTDHRNFEDILLWTKKKIYIWHRDRHRCVH